jgi:hypothetical protein
MHKDNQQTPVNRFSFVDVTIDVLLIATTFALPIRTPDLVSSLESGFLQNVALLGLLFIGYFGLALYVARMYYATALKKRDWWKHRVIFSTDSPVLFTCIILINILFSAYNIFQTVSPPLFTSILLIIEALVFGFTFGLDFAIERHRSIDPEHTIPPENAFSHSLTSIPYLLFTFILLYPLDYISLKLDFSPLARVVTLLGSCTAIYFLSGILNRVVFNRLQLTSRMNFTTIAVVSLLMAIGFMGLDVLEVFAKHSIILVGAPAAETILFLAFFGIVPLRVGTILFSRTVLFNKILGIVALACYLLIKSGLLQLNWLN